MRTVTNRLHMMSRNLITSQCLRNIARPKSNVFLYNRVAYALCALLRSWVCSGVVRHIRALAWLGNVVDVFQAALVRLSQCRGVKLSRSICDSGTATGAACASNGAKVVPWHKSLLARLLRFGWLVELDFKRSGVAYLD